MKKLLLFLILLSLCSFSSFAITDYIECYQESVNESSPADGNCNLNYSGTATSTKDVPNPNFLDGDYLTFGYQEYGITSGYRMIYYKPEGAIAVIWRVKDSTGTYDLEIPQTCFDKYPDKVWLDYGIYYGNSANESDYNCRAIDITKSLSEIHLYVNMSFYEESVIWIFNNPDTLAYTQGVTKAQVTIFSALGLVALIILLTVAFTILKLFENGADIETLIIVTISSIGLTIIILLGYIIINKVATSIL